MDRKEAIEQVFSYLYEIDNEFGPLPDDPGGKKEAREVLLALGVTDEEMSPMVGGIDDDTTMTTGNSEHSEGDSGTHP